MIAAGPMILFLLASQTASPQVPPPRGVNSAVLGTAEEFRVAGPARVCLMTTSVDLLPGENAYLDYLGIHFGIIRVVGRRGTFLVKEGDAWAEPRGGRLEEDWLGRTIARYRQHGRPRYLIYATSDYSPGRENPRVWIEGDALGRSNDRAILNRIVVHPDGVSGCRRRFVYGWDMILGAREAE